MKTRDGETLATLGMGTWSIGDSALNRSEEIAALHAGLDAGLTMLDTAEMYGNGRSEALIGEAIAQRRHDVFLVSKILPNHATFEGTQRHCRESLERLATDHLDLYLLHWRNNFPLAETIRGMEKLREDGLIRYWGVSNFDVDDLADVAAISPNCACNQILYNLNNRGTEFDLLPYHEHEGLFTIAYSPLGHDGTLLQDANLKEIAAHYETSLGPATPAQIALAWVLRRRNMIAIPKAASRAHMIENSAAREIKLTPNSLAQLDRHFNPPREKVSLEMI